MSWSKKLPPNLYERRYKVKGGRARIIYYIVFKDWKKVRRKFPAGDNLPTAIQLRNKLLGQNAMRHDFDKERAQGVTLSAWTDKYLRLKQAKQSIDKDRKSCQRLKEFFGNISLNTITTLQIEEYKQIRLEQEIRPGSYPKPATVNRELACLRAMLRLAADEGVLDKAPRVRFLSEDNERDRTVSEDEFEKVLGFLPHWAGLVVVVLRETGMRVSEAVSVKWSQVNLVEGYIELRRHTKTGKSRPPIPLSPQARTVLEEVWAARMEGKELVFLRDGKPLSRFSVLRAWKKACRKAGISGLWVHDLRRTFITVKVAKEKWDRGLVRLITGHRTDSAFDRYLKPSFEDLRKVVESRASASPQVPRNSLN